MKHINESIRDRRGFIENNRTLIIVPAISDYEKIEIFYENTIKRGNPYKLDKFRFGRSYSWEGFVVPSQFVGALPELIEERTVIMISDIPQELFISNFIDKNERISTSIDSIDKIRTPEGSQKISIDDFQRLYN